MADNAEYKVQLVQTEEIPAPDELIAGDDCKADMITISAAGEYKRGELLMAGDDGFIPATAAGVASAEACILCDSVTVNADNSVVKAGYFSGTFSAKSVILPYETENDNHDTLIEAVRAPLRKQGIYLV